MSAQSIFCEPIHEPPNDGFCGKGELGANRANNINLITHRRAGADNDQSEEHNSSERITRVVAQQEQQAQSDFQED